MQETRTESAERCKKVGYKPVSKYNLCGIVYVENIRLPVRGFAFLSQKTDTNS